MKVYSKEEMDLVKKTLPDELSRELIFDMMTHNSRVEKINKGIEELKEGITRNELGMKIKDGKIYECTENQLYTYWLHNYTEIYSWPDYLDRVKRAGTKIL